MATMRAVDSVAAPGVAVTVCLIDGCQNDRLFEVPDTPTLPALLHVPRPKGCPVIEGNDDPASVFFERVFGETDPDGHAVYRQVVRA